MSVKSNYLILAIMLTIGLWASSASAELFVHGPGGRVPDRVLIRGLGEFPLTDRHVDIHAIIESRSSEGGRKIGIPNTLELFFPSTESSAAHLVSVSSAAVKKGYVAELPAISSKDRVLRVFYGPRLVDRTGADVIGATVWFDGHGGLNGVVSSAMLNPSVQMSSGEKQVTAVIWKRGYDLSVVPVSLPPELLLNPEIKPPLAKDDIVLKPAQNGVREVTVLNGNVLVKEGSIGTLSYYRDSVGKYGFIYLVKDHVDGKWYSASGMLDGDETSYRLEDYDPAQYERTTVVKADELPSDAPAIMIRSLVEYTVRDVGTSSKSPAVEKSQFDPALARFLTFVGSVGVLSLFVIFIVIVVSRSAEERKNEQETKECKLLEMLEYCGIREKRGVLRDVEELSIDKLLESSSAAILRTTSKQVNELILDLDSKRMHLRKLEAAIKSYDQFIAASLVQMRDRMKETHYDIALALRTQIEEAERSRESILKSKTDLAEVIKKRKAAVVQIVATMEEMLIRARALISQVQGVGNLNELGNRAKRVMNDLLESFGTESSVNLDPSHIKKTQEERGNAQRSGISANDVVELGRFMEERKQQQ